MIHPRGSNKRARAQVKSARGSAGESSARHRSALRLWTAFMRRVVQMRGHTVHAIRYTCLQGHVYDKNKSLFLDVVYIWITVYFTVYSIDGP